MASPRYKLILTIGEDKDLPMIWKDKNKRPIDLTGYTFECILKSDQSTVIATYTSSDRISVIPATGTITISFPNSITNQSITQFASWELWSTNSLGKRKCLVKGQLTFIEP